MASFRGAVRRMRRTLGLPPVAPTILMYHRIAEPLVDPWGLAVSPAWFRKQMVDLRRFRSPMPLDELIRGAQGGSVPANAVAVTFDDGYFDNLVNAKPVLVEFGIPATLFLATGSIGQKEEFWWDELAKLTIGWPRASEGKLELAGKVAGWSFPRYGAPDAAAARQRAHEGLWSLLRTASPRQTRTALLRLRSAIGVAPRSAIDRAMTEVELVAWLDGGLTDIGAHTVSHRPLTAVAPEEIEAEVIGSMARCRSIAGRGVRGFAYPYGDRSDAVAQLVRALGVEWACSTNPAALPRCVDDFNLPRLQVRNGSLRAQWREG
ncbi:MAG TPA: polysaccharide deacetylase family protein [Devosiaceae bacterium]|nr:polysaccharide deacetylase family protein [Devosiaceae bacterium]